MYFDTMGHDPEIIRSLTGFFGAERVLAGTDWPILAALDGKSLTESLAEAGLNDMDFRRVAGGNARRLLGLRETKGCRRRIDTRRNEARIFGPGLPFLSGACPADSRASRLRRRAAPV
ncbi:amidohydrolase family protein [Ensifer canadensis]|uniref:amidohydrolase family protein n=1 Tax=Ensifer canadensis TaxID=555315 RepID=UPI003B5229DE